MPSGRGGGYVPYISNSYAIRQEIQRFESVHPSIYAIYDLIDLVHDPYLVQQIREHVVCIEGELGNIFLQYIPTSLNKPFRFNVAFFQFNHRYQQRKYKKYF